MYYELWLICQAGKLLRWNINELLQPSYQALIQVLLKKVLWCMVSYYNSLLSLHTRPKCLHEATIPYISFLYIE